MSNLIKIQSLTPEQIFEQGDLKILVDEVIKEVESIVIDRSDKKWIEETKSLAYKVAKTKTFIDATRKKYIEEKQDFIKRVNSVTKSEIERLQNLQDSIRKPVDDIEQAEKERIQNIKKSIQEISDLKKLSEFLKPSDIQYSLETVENFDPFTCEELAHMANEIKKEAIEHLTGILFIAQNRVEEEKKQQEIRRINEEKLQKERERAEREQKRIEEEAQRREADIENKRSVNNSIMNILVNEGLTENQAKSIVILIASGKIPNLKIIY